VRALADTSALVAAEHGDARVLERLEQVAESGGLWICDAVRLELLRGASSPASMATLRSDLDDLATAPIHEGTWRRAEEVYEGLARLRGGAHRGVSPTDLLVAAAAEEQGLTVIHKDRHFDLIAQVTGQPMVRVT
jgi:predicted nucleic acid-binding protein